MVYQFTGSNSLNRFLKRQEKLYDIALEELTAGKKRSCWMWYIFPQLRGLGTSRKSYVFGISDIAEARAYLNHPVLGARLVQCCQALLKHKEKTAEDIFECIDDVKLRSSMTLFAKASEDASVFNEVLNQFFDGIPDSRTLMILSEAVSDNSGKVISLFPEL